MAVGGRTGVPILRVSGRRRSGKSTALARMAALDLLAGAHGLFVSANVTESRIQYENVLDNLPESAVGRWNSRERTITTAGATLRFTSWRSVAQGAGRGLSVDRLYLDDRDDNDIESLMPALAGSRDPRIVIAHTEPATA